MSKSKLYNVARHYIEIIEQMEHTADAQELADLEEKRVIWHNKLLMILSREGVSFKDRESVTRLAYHLIRGNE